MNKNKNNGFTLLEMIISMTVISIMVAMAAPAFSEFVRNNKIYTSSKILSSDVSYAKSEGMKGIGNVVLMGLDGDLNKGWRVFIDENENESFDTGEKVLRVQERLSQPLVFTSIGQNFVSFNSYGENVNKNNIIFNVCDGRVGNFGKDITISVSGLIKYLEANC